MAGRYDAIIIGGGHNGLVCAAYLARAGRRVIVLEACEHLGGAAHTAEFHPGFKVSACAHLATALHPRIARDLKLARHGLAYAATAMKTVALDGDGALAIDGAAGGDGQALAAFRARMERFAATLRPLLTRAPPRLGSSDWGDRLGLARIGWAIRRLGRNDMREFMRIIGMNVADLVDETFANDLIKGAIAFDAVLGNRAGPRSPGTVMTLLHRLAGMARSGPSLPHGGMGAVGRALAIAASSAEIRTGARVARIVVEADRAVGVALDDGAVIAGKCVISNADPRTTLLDLLGPEHLDIGFTRRLRHIGMTGIAAKLHLALDGLPRIPGLAATPDLIGARLLVAPSVGYVETAFNASKYRACSTAPAIEITIPTLHDPSLAPPGKHVLSAIAQYAPHDLDGGWDQARDAFADRVMATLAEHAPDIAERTIARQLLTPADLERDFNLAGGHWHHGELALDRMLMLRPLPGCAQYATPLAGLYLCGAGSHPGGGVSGVPGYNAARRVLAGETA